MRRERQYYVYILANERPTLYIGVTGDLIRRVHQHRTKPKGFVLEFKITKLVYFEATNDVNAALNREKQLKRWKREWKLRLIKEMNPQLDDLSGLLR